ncbi:MAG TPA: FtsX-like permease family protein, partial [Geobacteraceae bacterium]
MAWIEKQRNIVDFTISSLWRRLGKNGALFAVYTLVVFFLGSVLLFVAAVKHEAVAVLDEAPAIIVQRQVAGRHDLIPLAYAEKIGEIRGVGGVHGRLWGYYFDSFFGANYTVMVGDDYAAGKGTVVVGSGVARHAMANEGNLMPFHTSQGRTVYFTVAHVLPTRSELVAADLVLMGEEDFRTLFAVPPGVVTDLAVSVANESEVATIARKISQLYPDTRPISRSELLRTYEAIFSWRGGIMLAVLAGAVLAFIIFAWDKATGLSAEERQEIGILKAVGWETTDIIFMKFWEGLVISLSAFLTGILLAYGHVFLAKSVVFAPVLKGWSVLYPDFRLTPYLDFQQLTTLFLLSVVPYTVAIIVPAWRAATVDPDLVLRS